MYITGFALADCANAIECILVFKLGRLIYIKVSVDYWYPALQPINICDQAYFKTQRN